MKREATVSAGTEMRNRKHPPDPRGAAIGAGAQRAWAALGGGIIAVLLLSACAGGKPGSSRAAAAADFSWNFRSDSGWAVTDTAFSRHDSLFFAATTGEPRFAALRDSCRRHLLAEGLAVVPYLLTLSKGELTPRQRHGVQGLLTDLSDSGRVPEVTVMLGRALSKTPDSAKSRILYYGSKLGDSAFRQVAWPYLGHDSLDVRLMAIRNLGVYSRHSQSPGLLLAGMDKADGEERQLRLWALSQQEAPFPAQVVLPWLGDSLMTVRQAAADALLRSLEGKFHPLSKAADTALASGRGWEYCRLSLRLEGSDAYLSRCDGAFTGDRAEMWADLRRASSADATMGEKKAKP